MVSSISASELSKLISSGRSIDLIDVRTPVEYREAHVAIAKNEPLDQLDPKAIQAACSGSSGDPLYVVCRSGNRSRQACDKLLTYGIANVVNIEGGAIACEAAGIPMVRGKKGLPLTGQVQIVTGLTVLAGAIATLVSNNPYWLVLPIFMGSGMLFAGLTNTCGLAMVLARMPWNQVKSDSIPTMQSSAATKTCETKGVKCCS
jgi:rhodanese-related sulfurtransferase